ncbi:MAG: hypothetical protein GX537_00225 [Actinobacteria bacterium]|nr:hypothetical protein [Actinomycetota bacterium]
MTVGTLILLFLIAVFLAPVVQLLVLEARRTRARHRLAHRRRTHVLDVVYHVQTAAVFGLPLVRWQSLPLTEETLRALQHVPSQSPLDLLIDMPAGVDYGQAVVADALARHGGTVTLVVPRQALSGSLLFALGANAVLMDPAAVIGAIHTPSELRTAAALLRRRLPTGEADAILQQIRRAAWTHDQHVGPAELRQLGLAVDTELPEEYRGYLQLYRHESHERGWPFLVRLPHWSRR